VSLLIPTHALPLLSYRVPGDLRSAVRPGAVVSAPLSGRPRLGVVVSTVERDSRAREDLLSVTEDLALPADLVELCCRVAEAAAAPLPLALRAALPPGLDTARYRVVNPAPGWPWPAGGSVSRAALRGVIGRSGLAAAEAAGRLELAPGTPESPRVEWAVLRGGADPDLRRAPRQREIFELLRRGGGERRVAELLSETGASRATLRELVRRGAVRLQARPEAPPVFVAPGEGSASGRGPFAPEARRALRRGGAWLWRTPRREQARLVAAVARAAIERRERTLVLAPEIAGVGHLVASLVAALPAGSSVAPYHNGLDRAGVYAAARGGSVDVLVGTRTAALLPLAHLGAICVVDEPNEGHRAEAGYEGLPLHVRDTALERARIEGASVFFLSPHPSLRLYAPEVRERERLRELPARRPDRWPSVRIVDLRGSGAPLSSTLLEACRRAGREGRRVGVVANRLGYATAVVCNSCGKIRSCAGCGLRLIPKGATGGDEPLVCARCGTEYPAANRCANCGSDRSSATGLALERVREMLSAHLGEPVGLLTAARRELADAAVVVGSARCVTEHEWDAVLVPDADPLLLAGTVGATERAFRVLYGAAEAAREILIVQTRLPEHYVLREAVRGDYPSFAAAELARLRENGLPPFSHLASLTLEGREETVRLAVESRLRPALEPGVEISGPVPVGRTGRAPGGGPAWRLLLRAARRTVVACAAGTAARLAAEVGGLKVRVEVDPEEV
jgi:primosomal protein N' (replication factor Y) (superfamily II helicase)